MSAIEMIGKMNTAKYALSLKKELSTKDIKVLRSRNDAIPSLDWLRSNGILVVSRQETFEMPFKDGPKRTYVLIDANGNEIPCKVTNYFSDGYRTNWNETPCMPNPNVAPYVDLAYNGGQPCRCKVIEKPTFIACRNFYTFDMDGYRKAIKRYTTLACYDRETLEDKIAKTTAKLHSLESALMAIDELN